MGIDGIGSKGPPAPPPPAAAPGAARAPETGRAFEVGKAAAPPAASATQVAQPNALDRLRAGEIDVNGYVDAKVHEATAHLGILPPGRLDEIRAALRDRMSSDPTLVDLLRSATGQAIPPRGED